MGERTGQGNAGSKSDDATRVMIVDDHPVVRQGLAALINGAQDLRVCAEAADPREALAVLKKAEPNVIVLDITLREASGLDLLRDIRVRYPNLPVLVLSMHDESVYAERSLRAGASGYVMKHEASNKVVEAIRTVAKGGLFVSEAMTDRLLRKSLKGGHEDVNSPMERLTDRQTEIFRLIGRGYGTKQIAEILCLSVKTIETHRTHIRAKLELDDARDLRRYAVEWAKSYPTG